MTDIAYHLERLGLEQYHDALVGEGFDTWETLLDIQESDLDSLNVKLGHRRKLQRAIAEYRGVSSDRPLVSPPQESGPESSRSTEGSKSGTAGREIVTTPAAEQKRKYRRHPKPDENAPEKPPSAYVLFSNKIREEVKGENLTFTEIARLVGDRWQKLDPYQKEPFESQAAALKETYNVQLSEYKKTDEYREYTRYLNDFRARHGTPADSKRPRLDVQQSSSSISVLGHEHSDVAVAPHGHARGGSLSSMSTTSHSGAFPSPSGIPLAPVQSFSNLHAPARFSAISGRSTSPPAPGMHERRLPAPLSSHSSVSEDSSAIRLEQYDPLSRAATLSLSTPPAVTPPLPSSASASSRSDFVSVTDPSHWSQRHHQVVQSEPASAVSSSGGGVTPFSSSVTSDLWRERAGEPGRGSHQPALPPFSQPGVFPISQLIGPERLPERFSDLTHTQAQRTLPPLRQPTRTSNVSSADASGNVGGSPASQKAGPAQSDRRRGHSGSSFDRSENEAATTLAKLARKPS